MTHNRLGSEVNHSVEGGVLMFLDTPHYPLGWLLISLVVALCVYVCVSERTRTRFFGLLISE